MAEEVLQEKTYISRTSYKRKDGTIVKVNQVKKYMANGRTPGRPRTEESILIAEIKKISNENKRKMMKYLNKLKDREKEKDNE